MDVKYRAIKKEDYNDIKELICEGFEFKDFIKDEKFLKEILNLYLNGCLIDSSNSVVAVKDGRVIGIILTKAKLDKTKMTSYKNTISALKSFIKINLVKGENKKSLKTFSKIQKVYKEFIADRKDLYDGSINLFIVSKSARGLGIGKKLLEHSFKYMRKNNCKNIYLYTDTICNYGFYDSQGFKRVKEKEIDIDDKNKLNVFLYDYNLLGDN